MGVPFSGFFVAFAYPVFFLNLWCSQELDGFRESKIGHRDEDGVLVMWHVIRDVRVWRLRRGWEGRRRGVMIRRSGCLKGRVLLGDTARSGDGGS